MPVTDAKGTLWIASTAGIHVTKLELYRFHFRRSFDPTIPVALRRYHRTQARLLSAKLIHPLSSPSPKIKTRLRAKLKPVFAHHDQKPAAFHPRRL